MQSNKIDPNLQSVMTVVTQGFAQITQAVNAQNKQHNEQLRKQATATFNALDLTGKASYVYSLYEMGSTQQQIADSVGCSQSYVAQLIARHRERIGKK